MNRNIPNALTLFRLLIVPPFVWLLYFQPHAKSISIALLLFVVGSVTDFLDGYFARKYNLISDFGKIMDPLADKFLVLSAISALCWLPPFHLPQSIFWIILGREVLITIMREIYKKRKIIVAADKLGKLKTVLQMLGIITALGLWAFLPIISSASAFLILIWFWIVAAITVLSGVNYLIIPKSKRS